MKKIREIKGILFDKDGTLLDFEKTWRPLWRRTEEQLKVKLMLSDAQLSEIKDVLGILEEGFTSDSIYVAGTILDYAEVVSKISSIEIDQVVACFNTIYTMFLEGGHLSTVPIGNPKELMIYLKSKGYKLGIVTADTLLNTEYFIAQMGMEDVLDFVATDDGYYQMKPHPHMLEAFCQQMNLEKEQVAMVGDTLKDMKFGKNNEMGLSIYVRSGYPNEEAQQMADYILRDVEELREILGA